MIEIKVREEAIGARSIAEMLKQIEPTLQKKVLKQALLRAGNVVRDEARRQAPFKSGLLRRKIQTRTGYSRRLQAMGAQVGVFGAPKTTAGKKALAAPYYARWVEEGHRIVPRRRSKQEGFTLNGRRVSRQQAREAAEASGRRVPPHPFLLPALMAKQAEVQRVLTEEIGQRLEAALRAPH